jgi:hypothetical protein
MNARERRTRIERLAERIAARRPDMLTDAQRAARIAALEVRAEGGDPEAVRRLERVRELLDLARARMEARA